MKALNSPGPAAMADKQCQLCFSIYELDEKTATEPVLKYRKDFFLAQVSQKLVIAIL